MTYSGKTRFLPVLVLAVAIHGIGQVSAPTAGAPTGTVGSIGSTGATGSSGATGTTAKTATTVSASVMPGEARDYLAVLGKRLTTPSLAQSVRTGTYTDASGMSAITVTWQNPGNVRAILVGPTAQTMTWNGSAKQGIQSFTTENNDLLDALADDCPEAFFFSTAQGAGLRLLGAHARVAGASANYAGPWYTIYQKFSPAPSTGAVAQKIFLFDSTTGLLSKVRYFQGTTAVEVQYSNWQLSGTEYAPGTVVRVVNGKTEFTINFGTAAFSVAGGVSIFSAP